MPIVQSLTRSAEPGRAGRPQSVRLIDWPSSTATEGVRSERRDGLRAAAANRVRSAAPFPILKRFRSWQLPRSGAQPFPAFAAAGCG